MRVSSFFDMGIVLLILAGAEAVWSSSNTEDGGWIPPIALHDADDTACLEHIPIATGNECLVGAL